MAGKRRATSELNYDNKDESYEIEEAGTFQKASEDSMKRRVIKTAKRRNPISSVRDNGESEGKSAFTGLMFSSAPPPSSNAFSFLSNLSTPTLPKTNGISESTSKPVPDTQEKFSAPTSSDKSIFGNTNSIFMNATNTSKSSDENSDNYYSKLKGLNESVSNWIKKHVDANPLVNLQPIFKDYERYFGELELENDKKTTTDISKPIDIEKDKPVSSMSGFVFKPSQNIPDSTTGKNNSDPQNISSKEPVLPKFSFGSQESTLSSGSKPTFGFGNMSTSKTFSLGTPNASTSTTPASISSSFSSGSKYPSTMSTFSSSTPFTFANVTKPTSTEGTKTATDTDDNYEPPKNDFKPVEESDYIYTIRCKVFVKKDDKFGDRGVGNLYLKAIENSEKFQLIVRADTNLESIPTKRMGGKDVMLVCLPTPDFKPPPVPILLRVKTSEEADKLLEVLEKHKK